MSYETFRASFYSHLPDTLSSDAVQSILAALDTVAADYDIQRKCTDIIAFDGIPEVVRMYIASRSVENVAKSTLSNYYHALSDFFQSVRKPFDQITTNDVRVYLHQYRLAHSVKESTLNHIRTMLNSFYTWLVDEDLTTKNPVRRISSIKAPESQRHAMTSLELETMRTSCETLREKALVDFLFSTACRVQEAADMLLTDIDLQSGLVQVRHGKGDKARRTYLNAESIVSLRAYLASRQDDCPYLFATARRPCHQMTSRAMQQEIQHIASRAKVTTHVTPHVFRHTAATSALRAGMPIEQVQRFLGHSSVDTTLIYAKVDDSDVRSSHAKYMA